MKRALVLLALSACHVPDAPANGPSSRASSKSTDSAAEPPARMLRIFEHALKGGHAHALLSDLCTVAPRRLAGSEGAEQAVAWAVRAMQQIGLSNVRKEPVLVPQWVRGDTCSVRIVGAGFEEELRAIALGNSVGTSGDGLLAEVVMVRSFEQLRALGERAHGKIVFFNRPMPRVLLNTFQAYGSAVDQRAHGAVEAAKVGALAALVRSMTTALDDLPHTGSLAYADDVPKVPAAALSTNAAERLAALLESGAAVQVRMRLSCEMRGEVMSANVVGEIPGASRPEEIVLIGAHLDAWDVGQGAHDDGAGCAHCLEAARLVLASGERPARTIRVVLFMNEENGLRGATAYAESHAAELPRHVAAIESDRGGFLPLGFTCSLEGDAFAGVKELVRPLAEFGMGALIKGGGGADIARLASAGVPLYELVISPQRYFDVHHCDRDRVENVNERELALGAAGLAWLALCLADR